MQALVIDDSKAVRMMLRRALTGLGFSVVEAEDGFAGLVALADHPDSQVVLVDWNMPRLNGINFLKLVRAKPEYQDLVVMMVTSESGPEQVAVALEAGANEFVMKPFTPEMIQEKLAMLGVL